MSFIVFDVNISPDIVKVLLLLGEKRVKHLRAICPHDTDDLEFLPRLAEQKAILVTCDLGMARTPSHRLMLLQGNNTAVFLPDSFLHAGPWEQAHWLLKYWKQIIAQIQPGGCYSVSKRGKAKPIDLLRYKRKVKKAVDSSSLIGGIEEAVENQERATLKPHRRKNAKSSPGQLVLPQTIESVVDNTSIPPEDTDLPVTIEETALV